MLIVRAICGQSRSFTLLQQLLKQSVNQSGLVAFATEQSVDVSFYVGFVRESEQIEKVSIDFHVFDVACCQSSVIGKRHSICDADCTW